MALITEKAIVLILVIGFVQIVHLQARHTDHVSGPRQHLDSGQDFGEPSLSDFEQHRHASHLCDMGILEDLHDMIEIYERIIEDKKSQSNVKDMELNYHDFNDFDDTEDEDYNYRKINDDHPSISQVPLKRVRRRIIPIGGGALDRGRSDRNGPYERSRSPWGQAPRNKDAFARRSGPTGSAALFSLFPDLAPPEWKATKKAEKKKKASNKEKDKESKKNKRGNSSTDEKLEEKSQKDEPSSPDSATHQKRKTQKKKTKISKKEKEEIAKFAESHGVEKAVAHFKARVNAPLRANAVEKFLRRYKNRMQRKANRS